MPFPAPYVVGLDRKRLEAEAGLPSFGFSYASAREWLPAGWGNLEPRTLILKVSLAAWVLVGWAFVLSLARPGPRWTEAAFPWCTAAVVLGVAACQVGITFPLHALVL